MVFLLSLPVLSQECCAEIWKGGLVGIGLVGIPLGLPLGKAALFEPCGVIPVPKGTKGLIVFANLWPKIEEAPGDIKPPCVAGNTTVFPNIGAACRIWFKVLSCAFAYCCTPPIL